MDKLKKSIIPAFRAFAEWLMVRRTATPRWLTGDAEAQMEKEFLLLTASRGRHNEHSQFQNISFLFR